MSSELYKIHRPRLLKHIVGNTETVTALKVMLIKGTLPHTILFSGPSGCGKTTIARILASKLECHEMDLTEVNCAQARGIDTIRDIQQGMRLSPVGGEVSVWILDECHALSRDAQGGLLKMLEDTPPHCYFFLATTDPHKLLPTILTRCSHMPVTYLSDTAMEQVIRRVTEKEGIEIEDDIVSELASVSGGSSRKALVLLDKIRNLPPKQQSDALKGKSEDENQAIDLCRALLKKEPWGKVTKILKGIKAEPENTRWAVLGYMRNVLLGGPNHRAYEVICCFESDFFQSKEAGLVRACFEATHSNG